jgi:hypothetical protein
VRSEEIRALETKSSEGEKCLYVHILYGCLHAECIVADMQLTYFHFVFHYEINISPSIFFVSICVMYEG